MAISGESVSSAERMMNVGQQRDLRPTSQVAKFFCWQLGEFEARKLRMRSISSRLA
jgi:hypothetical protein